MIFSEGPSIVGVYKQTNRMKPLGSEGNSGGKPQEGAKEFYGNYQKAERHPRNAQTPAPKVNQGIRGREEMFSENNPAGGYEVLSKPPLWSAQ
jgi:hypothetical protein